jgi:Crinkler effector protein N-terminal domain
MIAHPIWLATSSTTPSLPAPMRLNCLVFGDTSYEAFPIKVARTMRIAQMKRLVKELIKPRLDEFPTEGLQLWKVDIDVVEFDDRKGDFDSPQDIPNSQRLRQAFDEVSDHWPEEPPKRALHVVVAATVDITASGMSGVCEYHLIDYVNDLSLCPLLRPSAIKLFNFALCECG